MRCAATEILLLIGVTAGVLIAARADVEAFFVSARQRRLKETRKYIAYNFIFNSITITDVISIAPLLELWPTQHLYTPYDD